MFVAKQNKLLEPLEKGDVFIVSICHMTDNWWNNAEIMPHRAVIYGYTLTYYVYFNVLNA